MTSRSDVKPLPTHRNKSVTSDGHVVITIEGKVYRTRCGLTLRRLGKPGAVTCARCQVEAEVVPFRRRDVKEG
jgi:hypothetical protein